MASRSTNALELELGIGYTRFPFYYNVDAERYPDQYNKHVIGKIAVEHTFDLNKNWGIKAWLTHYSLAWEHDPMGGLDILGTSFVYEFK